MLRLTAMKMHNLLPLSRAEFVAACHPDGILLPDQGCHHYGLIVQYEDSDAGGIVYHAHYLNYAERARSAVLRAGGIHLGARLRSTGEGIIIRQVEARYHAPAQLHDQIIVVTRLEQLKRASLRLAQHIISPETGLIFARLLVEGVWVNKKYAPCRFPDDVREIITHLSVAGEGTA